MKKKWFCDSTSRISKLGLLWINIQWSSVSSSAYRRSSFFSWGAQGNTIGISIFPMYVSPKRHNFGGNDTLEYLSGSSLKEPPQNSSKAGAALKKRRRSKISQSVILTETKERQFLAMSSRSSKLTLARSTI